VFDDRNGDPRCKLPAALSIALAACGRANPAAPAAAVYVPDGR